ncbi:hypothetical protein P3342_000561 [Pyrenophora teres f. teres]|nr:hypothetical protein P3342_000561 [Pyrenophora teres f. teres]
MSVSHTPWISKFLNTAFTNESGMGWPYLVSLLLTGQSVISITCQAHSTMFANALSSVATSLYAADRVEDAGHAWKITCCAIHGLQLLRTMNLNIRGESLRASDRRDDVLVVSRFRLVKNTVIDKLFHMSLHQFHPSHWDHAVFSKAPNQIQSHHSVSPYNKVD